MHSVAMNTSVTAGGLLQHRLPSRQHVRSRLYSVIGAAGLPRWLPRASCYVKCNSSISSFKRTATSACSNSSTLVPSRQVASSSSCRQLSSSSRLHVIAAGRPRKSEQQPVDPDSPEALSQLTVAELRARCGQLGLPRTGKKAELVSQLADYLQGASSSTTAATAGGTDATPEDDIQTTAAAAAAEPAAVADVAGDDDISLEELRAELEAELITYSKAELVKCLQDRELPATGNKAELVSRLAAAVAEESLAGDLDAEEQQQAVGDFTDDLQAASTADRQQQQQAAGVFDDELRKWAVADKQQDYYDQLLRSEEITRENLIQTLAELNQTAAEDETMEELIERVSWLLAEEEQRMEEEQLRQQEGGQQQQQQQPALQQSRSSFLDSITATDINKMKVTDLRNYLQQLGLSAEGGRYVLRDRLMTMLVVRRAATAGDMDHLLEQLSQMTLSELRLQLESRGLDLSGSKAALELRLAEALVIETVGPEAAAAMGKVPEEEEEEDVLNPLLEDYDELLTAAVDPAVRVALVCGTAPVVPGASRSSSIAAKLQRVAEALATANTLIDELHTAPLDEDQAAAMEAAAAHSEGSTQQEQQSPETPAVPRCGVSVDVYWATDDGVIYQLPRSALAALAPADVAVRLPALATATFADADAFANHLVNSGAQAALSTLPGGAMAMSGKLSQACDTAGVPLAGGPAFESDKSKQLAHNAGPVFSRGEVLQELQGLGYNTLPALHISMQDLQSAAAELASWLQEIEQGIVEQLELEEDLNEAEGADEEEADTAASITSGSEILKTWNGRADDEDESAAAAADEAEEEESKVPALVERVLAWCKENSINSDLQVLTVSSSVGGGPLGCSRGYIALVKELLATIENDSTLPGVLVEPLYRSLVRWEVAVLPSAEDGPVALLPAELEQYSVLEEMADADLALQEWQMMQEGLDDEEISTAIQVLSAPAPPQTLDLLETPSLPDPMPHHTLKVHMPPRASNKVTQTIRHAAAKAVAQLGLEGAGLVRVSGWLALKPDWQEQYTLPPEALQNMPDFDAGQLARLAAEEAEKRASEPNPLCDYFDEELHMADLAAFDQKQRTRAEGNGEADVLIGAVDVDVPLASSSIAGLQAFELGITPGGIARHLINLALIKHGKNDLLLPPPAAPPTADSAQWSQATGVNDSLPEIMEQLADEAVKAREEEDTAEYTAAVKADREAFASQPLVDSVREVMAALTTDWLTEEELCEEAEEPDEWTPEFDPRTQEEIHAERDAGRSEEDLAARAMRDEGLFTYGNQPIKYDRWDDGDNWVPPAFIVEEALAEGKPYPSVQELREQVEQQQEAKRQLLLDRAYSEEDRLPEVTEDEVLLGRILGHDRYRGGVIETLQRQVNEQGRDTGSIAAAAAAAAAAAEGADADAPIAGAGAQLGMVPAAGAAVLDGSSGASDEWTTWPLPDETAVLDEAMSRRPAPRVWVVVGGDGPQRQQAFRSGANVAAKLQRCCDLQVDVFLMPPTGAGEGDARRRSALLSRRTEWRALGIPEELFPESMSDAELINTAPADVSLLNRQLIVVGPQQLARHTLEEAAAAAERAGSRATQPYHAAHPVLKQQLESQFETQMELDAHFIQGVGSAWGAVSCTVLPPAPRFMNLEEMLSEATACDATLLLLLDDSSVSSGELQQVLEAAGLPFTGTTADFAFKLSNRLSLAKSIDELIESLSGEPTSDEGALEGSSSSSSEEAAAAAAAAPPAAPIGLVAVPRKVVKVQELIGFLDRPQEFEEAYYALLHEWDDATSVVLKPSAHSGGLGVMRVSSPDDLAAVAEAYASCAPRIAAGTLTHQPLPITLPMTQPELLLVEPWIETDPVAVNASGEVQWAGNSRWAEVSVGLIGELGAMQAFAPTLIAHTADGSRVQFTPAPQHILPPAAVEAVQGFAVTLADWLGLRSIAQVDGFVNVDSGELIVLDVQQLPDLTDGSTILQQALASDPPMLPYQLFRHLAQQAFITAAVASDTSAADDGSAGSAYYAPDAAGGSGFGAEDFDLGVDQGLGAELFAEGAGDEEDVGVSDEDMEGMAAGWTRQ